MNSFLKFTLVVGNDTTLRGVHTDTKNFQSHSPDQVQYLFFSKLITDAHSA